MGLVSDDNEFSKGAKPYDVGRMTCVRTTAKAILVEGKLRDGKVGQIWCPEKRAPQDEQSEEERRRWEIRRRDVVG